MSENVTLTPLTSIQNDTTAVTKINSNSATITTAFSDVLSRSGVQPNSMNSALDMNSNRIINLPTAISVTEPVTLAQVNSALAANGNIATGTTSVPVSAAMQPVVNASTLTIANTDLGTAPFYFKSGSPWTDVKAWGAVGNGVTDDSTAMQNAINYAGTTGSIVFFPPGTYFTGTGLTVPSNVILMGAGCNNSVITAATSAITTITFNTNSFFSGAKDLAILGQLTATAAKPAVIISSAAVSVTLRDCRLLGGNYGLSNSGVDCLLDNCNIGGYTGGVLNSNTNWYIRCKIDTGFVAGGPNTYGFNQTAPGAAGPIEVHLEQCDLSNWTTPVVVNDAGANLTVITICDSVVPGTVTVTSSLWATFNACQLSGPISVASGGGAVSVVGSWSNTSFVIATTGTGSKVVAGNVNIT